jgi:hypothetical protein
MRPSTLPRVYTFGSWEKMQFCGPKGQSLRPVSEICGHFNLPKVGDFREGNMHQGDGDGDVNVNDWFY